MMAPERWRRVEDLYYGALDLDDGGRAAYLDAECAGDAELRREIDSLLDAGLDEAQIVDILGHALDQERDAGRLDASHPERLGPYRLVREIGRGGLGTVYLADRDDEHYSMRVAIKLVRRGLDTDDVLKRLRRERQILARLEHPNITRLLDGGSTRGGQPYLVMEYVEGDSLLDHADRRRLGIRDRIRLMLDVCHAVDAAHRNLIIHRDLKPSNVLVTGDGTVKLLDFGIAQLLDQDPGLEQTRPEQRLLTPAYASPEQLDGQPLTTATDIFSLGAVLYRLLTGVAPFQDPRRSGGGDSSPPSTQVDAEERARLRGSTPAALSRSLRGDLDNIVLRALSTRAEDRYATATALAEDLQRFLDDRPVLARPPSLAGRLWKLVRRNRLAAGVVALAAFGLVISMVAVAWQAQRATRARVEAERVSDFLTELIEAATPETARGKTLTVASFLDQGAERISVELADEPAARARLMGTMGRAFQSLGDYPRARGLQRETLAVRRDLYGPESLEWASSAHDLAGTLIALGELEPARELLLAAESTRRRDDPDSDAVADTLNSLAQIERRRRRPEEAERLYRKSLEIYQRNHGARHEDIAGVLNNLGVLYRRRGRFPEAEAHFRGALDIRREKLGDDHPNTLSSLDNLARVLRLRGQLPEAGKVLEQVVETRRRLLGPDHRDVAISLNSLAKVYMEQDQPGRAADLYRQAIPILDGALGAGSTMVASATTNLGEALQRAGRTDDAEVQWRRSVSMFDALPESTEHGRALESLGDLLCREDFGNDDSREGEALLRRAVDIRGRLHTDANDRWRVAAAQAQLGGCLLHQGRSAEAIPLLENAVAVLTERFGPEAERTQEAAGLLGRAEAGRH